MSKIVIESNCFHPVYSIELVMQFLGGNKDIDKIFKTDVPIVEKMTSRFIDDGKTSFIVKCENKNKNKNESTYHNTNLYFSIEKEFSCKKK